MFRTVAFVIVAILAFGSLAVAGELSYGAKLGLNMASQTIDPKPSGLKGRTGFGLGAVINYKLDDKMAITTDVLYLQKGSKYDAGTTTGEIKLDYLSIDPMFTYKFAKWDCKINPGHDANAFFAVGPELAMKISAKDQDGTKISDAKSMDFGLNIGAGVSIPMGKGHLVPELRYSMGMAKAIDAAATTTSPAYSAKNGGIQILFGYMF